MSEGKQVASLYAKIGFKISSEEFEKVKQWFNTFNNALQEIITKAGEFASQLSNISKETGVSAKTIQSLRAFGLEAGVAENSIDNLLSKMTEVKDEAYWNNLNELMKWGFNFNPLATPEENLEYLLKFVNSFKGNVTQLRTALSELGVDYVTVTRLAEQYGKAGLSSSFSFLKIDDEDIERLKQVRDIQKSISRSWDLLPSKIFSKHSKEILWYEDKIKKYTKLLQESLVDIADTNVGKKLLGNTVKYIPLITAGLNQVEDIYSGLQKTFNLVKKTGTIGLTVGLTGLTTSLVSGLMTSLGYLDLNLTQTVQNGINQFLDETGIFGEDIKRLIAGGLNILEAMLKDLFPDSFTESDGFKQFFETARDPTKGIVTAVSELTDRLVKKLLNGIEALWNKTKDFFDRMVDKFGLRIYIALLEFYRSIANEIWGLPDIDDERANEMIRNVADKLGVQLPNWYDEVPENTKFVADNYTKQTHPLLFQSETMQNGQEIVDQLRKNQTPTLDGGATKQNVSFNVNNYNGKVAPNPVESYKDFSEIVTAKQNNAFGVSKTISSQELNSMFASLLGGTYA